MRLNALRRMSLGRGALRARRELSRPTYPRATLTDLLLNDGNTVAWYQPGVGVTGTLNASAWADQSGNGNNLAQGTGANQPIVLPWTGANYGYISGVTGNYLSTPVAAANQITTGTLDVRVKMALNDWTPSANVDIVSRVLNDGQSAYRLIMRSDNFIEFAYTSTGAFATLQQGVANAATGITDAADSWIRVTYVTATGKVNFYKSADGETWVSIGSEISITAGSIFAGTDALQVGQGTNDTITGKVYRFLLYSGSTLKQELNAADWSETTTNGATQVSSTTGETWTLNNTGAKPAQIVGSAQLLFDGTAHFMNKAFTLIQPETVYLVFNQRTWTILDTVFDGAAGGIASTMQLAQSTATPNLTIFGGLIIGDNGNLAVNTYGIASAVFNGASSSLQINNTTAVTGNAGASNADGVTLGANGLAVTAQFGNIQVKELIVRASADSAATRLAIQQRLAAIHGITL